MVLVSTSHPPQNAIPRSDLNFDSDDQAESYWIEILREHKPSIIVRFVYRHPSSNHDGFMSQLETLIRFLTQSKHQVFILGDMKIDFLKVDSHSKTKDYLDMLWYSSNLLPVITKRIRITSHTATLIDLIYMHTRFYRANHTWYCNFVKSDHLPTFCFITRQIEV